MPTNFPTSLDSLTNPLATDTLNSPSHSGQHANANDAIEALEAKVGVNGSAVTTSHDYKIAQLETNGATLTGAQTLTNKTIALGSNTVSGTLAQFNTAVTDADLVSLAGSETLTNKTISLGSNSVSGTLAQFNTALTDADFASLAGSETLTNKTINGAILDRTEENWNIVASAATGTINFDVLTASIWYYTSNATANHTVNVRGDGSTTLSSLLNTGDSITVVWANTNGTTAYWPSTFQVDGSTITPKWQGGTAPTGGNASAIDVYTYVIVKTAATPTYTAFASQSQFK